MICREAELRDFPVVQQLWQNSFNEDARYVMVSLSSPASRPLVLEDEGEVRSMMLVFFNELVFPNDSREKLCYVYAFCTAAGHRSKGYGRALLDYTERRAAAAGYAGVYLVPGEPSLFDFYGTLGYSFPLKLTSRSFSAAELPAFSGTITPCSPMRYLELREAALCGLPHLRHAAKVIYHQKLICALSNADLYEIDGTYPVAVEAWDKDHIILKELLMPEGLLPIGAAAVHSLLHGQGYTVRTPGDGTVFGLLKPLKEISFERLYLGFAFD